MTGRAAEQLLQLASALRQSGRVPEAIDAYERLLAVDPNLPDSWYNLGYLQRRARRHEAALASYRQALDRGVREPEEVHLNRAVILSDDLARPDDARRELTAALARNPGYVPALLNLGNLHEDGGDRAAASAAYEKALAVDPFNALALGRLAGVKRRLDVDDPLIARLKTALARPGLDAGDRADLGFGLGNALDRVAAYDDAFAVFSDANRASKASAAALGVRYDRRAHEGFVDALIRAIPQPIDRTALPIDVPQPVFICGMFRSGSTLVEQMLASHSEVTAGGELDLMPFIVREHLQGWPESSASIDSATLRRLRGIYSDGIASLFPGAALVTDKRPDNFLYVGLIKTLFPDARIVHTHRDPLDNCLSIFFLHLAHSKPYAFDLADIAHWYGQYRRLMTHWKTIYGEAIHDVAYDRLVAEPRHSLERLLAYCELPWSDACLSFHESTAVVKTASVWQVRQPLYQRSSGRWRNYEHHLGPLRAALDRQLS